MKSVRRSNVWVLAVAAVALLPALLLLDATPDNELRYLSIADEALRNGSLVCFTNHGDVYADKPPLYLWIVMLGRMLFGQNCLWFIRLFSLVPMLLCGLVMDRWAAPVLSMRQRVAALLMLFTCGFFPGLGLVMRMDMLMTLFILLALRQAYRMAFGGPTRAGEALLGLWTFLALFTKGPLGVLIPLLGSLVWMLWIGRGRCFRRVWGWPAWAVLLGGCALWFGAVFAEGGPGYLNNLLFHQTVDRSVNAFTHSRPWWYYAAHIWYIMAPWSLLIAVLAVIGRRKVAVGPFRRMCIAAFGVTFVMLSCISSKLQVYMLPAIPFGVYLGASLIDGGGLAKIVDAIALSVLAVVFLASFALPVINPAISYGPVCREAAARNPREVLVSSDVRRGENIDAYFSCPVRIVGPADSVPPAGAVLIIPDDNKSITFK